MFLLNNLKQTSEKNVAPGGAQTYSSYSLGKHPNHLDHWLYMLLTVLNSPLRAYWSGPGLWTCALPSAVMYVAHLHIIWQKTSAHLAMVYHHWS